MRPPLLLAVLLLIAAGTPAVAGGHPSRVDDPARPAADSPDLNATVTGLYRARGGRFDGLTTAAAVERARERGTVEPAGRIVPNDLLVVEIESQRLVARMQDRSEPTTTARFFGLVNGTNATLTVRQLNPTPQRTPKEFVLAPASTRVVAGNGTVYVLIDTGAARLRWLNAEEGVDPPELYPGEVFGARFHVGRIDTYDGFETAPTVAFVEPAATLARADTEPTPRLDATGDELTVSTTVAPGERVRVRVVGVRTGRTLLNRTVRAPPRGRAVVPLPDGTVASGTNVTVVLQPLGYEAEQTRVRARAVHPTARIGPAKIGNPTTTAEAAVRLRRTRLAMGGFLVLTGPSGTVLDAERHRPDDSIVSLEIPGEERLAPGAELTVTAYRDTNHDGQFGESDEPYRTDGTVVRSTVVYAPPTTPTRGPTATATDTATATATDTPTATVPAPGTTAPGEPTGTTQPGFGPATLAAALAVLLATRSGRRSR